MTIKKLESRITGSGIDDVLIVDYYYPNSELPKDEEPRYGRASMTA